MNRLFFIVLLLFLSVVVYADDNNSMKKFLESEILTPEDIRMHLFSCWGRGQDCKPIELLGIHQNGNQAQVYILTNEEGCKKVISRKLIRFNSGKWFDLETNFYVIKFVFSPDEMNEFLKKMPPELKGFFEDE